MVHEEYKELIPARALSSLGDSDDRLLSEHLATCPECKRELESWTSVAASLALGTRPAEPSPRVRERILKEIEKEQSSTLRSVPEAAKVIPFASSKRDSSFMSSITLLAASLALLTLAVSVFILWKRDQQARTQVATLSTQLNSVEQQLSENNELLSFLTSPGKTFAELSATKAAPGAHAVVAYDKSGHAVLVAEGLPTAPPGKAYQLWYISGKNKPVPGGTFTTDKNGKGLLEDQLPSGGQPGTVFAITVEPAAGSPAPTSDILVLSGS